MSSGHHPYGKCTCAQALADGAPGGAVVDVRRRLMWAANEATTSGDGGLGAPLPACAVRHAASGVLVLSFDCILDFENW